MCVVPGEEPAMKNSIPKGDPKGLAALDALSVLHRQELDARWKAAPTKVRIGQALVCCGQSPKME